VKVKVLAEATEGEAAEAETAEPVAEAVPAE